MNQCFRFLIPGLIGVALSGCLPSGSTQADEEKETHFLTGKARVSGMDYRGAVEAFDEALIANPRSASAHFELGWLYAEKESDPAAAIYHYQKFLQLRPADDKAEVIKQHIFRLKQDLAKAVLPLPSTPGVQREFEQLAEENRKLKDELDRLKGFMVAKGLSPSNAMSMTEHEARGQTGIAAGSQARSGGDAPAPVRTSTMRTHRVQAGESPLAIARKYHIRLDAFMAANPGLNPKRMQVGQIVNVPGP